MTLAISTAEYVTAMTWNVSCTTLDMMTSPDVLPLFGKRPWGWDLIRQDEGQYFVEGWILIWCYRLWENKNDHENPTQPKFELPHVSSQWSISDQSTNCYSSSSCSLLLPYEVIVHCTAMITINMFSCRWDIFRNYSYIQSSLQSRLH